MNINKLEMARAISQDSRIEIKRGFLGLGSSVTYLPTASKVKVFKTECSAELGQKMEKVLNATDSALDKAVAAVGKFRETTLGNYMLEGLLSADHEFAALRLYRFAELSYSPVTPLAIFEGANAHRVSDLF